MAIKHSTTKATGEWFYPLDWNPDHVIDNGTILKAMLETSVQNLIDGALQSADFKLSGLAIDADKDWNGKSITNVKDLGITGKLTVGGAIDPTEIDLPDDAPIYFDTAKTKSLKWDSGGDRFEMTDRLAVGRIGNLAPGGGDYLFGGHGESDGMAADKTIGAFIAGFKGSASDDATSAFIGFGGDFDRNGSPALAVMFACSDDDDWDWGAVLGKKSGLVADVPLYFDVGAGVDVSVASKYLKWDSGNGWFAFNDKVSVQALNAFVQIDSSSGGTPVLEFVNSNSDIVDISSDTVAGKVRLNFAGNDVTRFTSGLVEMYLGGPDALITLGVVDDFSRTGIWHKGTDSIIRLGSNTADGDPTDVTSEGIVVWYPGVSDYAARIKANRFGLTKASDTSLYYFRVDDTKLMVRDPALTDYILWADMVSLKVGIGTNAPTEKLHVVGNAYITGKLTVGGAIDPTEIDLPDDAPIYFDTAKTYSLKKESEGQLGMFLPVEGGFNILNGTNLLAVFGFEEIDFFQPVMLFNDMSLSTGKTVDGVDVSERHLVYEQTSEPTVSAGKEAIWHDTTGGNEKWWHVWGTSGGNKKCEMS